jgi:serine/threonine protein kinase
MDRDRKAQDETLAALLERVGVRTLQAPELDRLLGIVLRVCDAAALAHRCNLLHCNLEPGTVRVGHGGQAHVTDAGVGIGGEHLSRPGEGDVVATPGYMAPEQAWGRCEDFDARTDVYGIGGILYAILTRTAPHDGGSASADLALAKRGTVRAPREVCPQRSLPPALCHIAQRSLSANPSERYPSVEVLKHDIEHFLAARQPVQQLASA